MEFKVINGMATVHIADEKKALAFKTRNMLSTIIWDIEQHCPKLHERG